MVMNGWHLISGDLELNVSKMKFIELSKLNPNMDADEVINYLLDNGYDSVLDNVLEHPNNIYLIYSFDKLYNIWGDLKKRIK